MMTTQHTIDYVEVKIQEYHEDSIDKWWMLEDGWEDDLVSQAFHLGMIEYICERVDLSEPRYMYASAERDLLLFGHAKAYIDRISELRDDKRLLARVAAHLENCNWHGICNSIRNVLIGGVPEKVNADYREALRGCYKRE